ncbi:nitronate monooxygenase [Massilia cavernae]|uniref:nitronate monooxygenase n=1 Tax=Massilia cavernae TaxID=2320864 RepID=UPI001C717CBC|nr:nitronate monooxygenase [Massilia cavernae]
MKSPRTPSPAVIALSPQHRMSPQIAIGACRAGGLGLLDLGIRGLDPQAKQAVAELARANGTAKSWGLRCDLFDDACTTLSSLGKRVGLAGQAPVLLLAGVRPGELQLACGLARGLARTVYLEVGSLREALDAQRAGYDGLVAKGNEAGGRVGQRSAFMLAQEFAGKLKIPYWIQGGIGVHSAAAVVLSGAAGVVLCEQLWLTAEAPAATGGAGWAMLDGSETALAGAPDTPYRCFSRSGRAKLRELELAVARAGPATGRLAAGNLVRPDDGVLACRPGYRVAGPYGQGGCTWDASLTAVASGIASGLAAGCCPTPPFALAATGSAAHVHTTRFRIARGRDVPRQRTSHRVAAAPRRGGRTCPSSRWP